ncbi:peptide chain release factor 3 [Opitutus terrae]|uniref:Peptide chain release factor 3 n=1 Tax=Opitutus terrae (strain DSM 11246 / JCM 15787 / PB90-1) TaxID=452637 RepID=B1ZV11_OPITP|nr:GTP-binding protein [Opitutus terrae]ACB75981.1 peptide chain release factor 3 [Opitutus terrae PB90-1]
MSPAQEIARRRTFAIISHPDAGKTTLTEKFLLYGNAIHLAGTVTARKNQRATASDWMELEKQRGISISSTVLQFDYSGFAVNLLDTPGHKDFSEDTYRVLTAVDAALMVIDAAKGVEAQTRKLFEVCRRRGIPIFTFMNKCDRPTRNALELLDELESVLGLQSSPVVWPLGNGPSFRGVFDRRTRQVHLFERVPGGAFQAPVEVASLSDPIVREKLDDYTYEQVKEQLEMLDGAGHPFNLAAVRAGQQTPVYFGSAINNFGIQLLLDGFLNDSVPPAPRRSAKPFNGTAQNGAVTPPSQRDNSAAGVAAPGPGSTSPAAVALNSQPSTLNSQIVPVTYPKFSAFVFKIQANMDPKHRDRIAFVRICSGKFERDMVVNHPRSGKSMRLSSSHKLFGQERETVDEAWPGDVIGLVGHSEFHIGDTLTEDKSIEYDEIPRFPPEVFTFISNPNPSDAKKFRAGLDQLLQEGVVQSLNLRAGMTTSTLLAAVGQLQFEVVQFRLESEYGAASRLDPSPWTIMKWMTPANPEEKLGDPAHFVVASGVAFGTDKLDQPVALFPTEWTMRYFLEKNPSVKLHDLPLEQAR